jgi:hypothetical protein
MHRNVMVRLGGLSLATSAHSPLLIELAPMDGVTLAFTERGGAAVEVDGHAHHAMPLTLSELALRSGDSMRNLRYRSRHQEPTNRHPSIGLPRQSADPQGDRRHIAPVHRARSRADHAVTAIHHNSLPVPRWSPTCSRSCQ